MRIVFIHRTTVDYTVETPYVKGVGGTEAGISYLSVELAKLGHAVTLLASPSTPGHYRGVECLHHRQALTAERLNAADAVIVVNQACGSEMRETFRVRRPLIAWIGHADDQDPVQRLEFIRERKAWTAFAFVSRWQLREFCRIFWIDPQKCRVLRNAISPAFAQVEILEPWFRRQAPPLLVYTSAPYRGLDVLIAAFPAIRGAIPGTRLRIFSGMGDSLSHPLNRPYQDLYGKCRATDGAELVGRVGQTQLAREVAEAAALAYPSTFPETSCIAVMEAMSVGAAILTAELGALPETTAGFADMVRATEDKARLARDFSEMAIAALLRMRADPDAADAKRRAQVTLARKEYSWASRALEWQAWLSELVRQHDRAS